MNRQQEKILIAALCGLVITAAGALAVQPAMAAGHAAAGPVQVSGVDHWVDTGRAAPWHVLGSAIPFGANPDLLVVPSAANR